MGTRGAVGFRLHENDKLTYNHFDSYPGWLGNEIITHFNEFVKTAGSYEDGIGLLKQMVLSMEEIDEDIPPTETQKEFLKEHADLEVSRQSLDDWYCLLRNTQGNIIKIAEARYFSQDKDFMFDSLFCEYAYIINLDTEMLEFYKGFNKSMANGRYGEMERAGLSKAPSGSNMGYGSVTLMAEFPLRDLNENLVDEMNKLTRDEDEEA